MLKSVKVREENYEWLARVAGELQGKRGARVSIDEALSWLKKKGSIMEFAGSWKMTDRESELLLKRIRGEWRAWKPKYA